jgi:REP element-mobilizing transposase RayT
MAAQTTLFRLEKRGGVRKGAGRKRLGPKRLPHRARQSFRHYQPLHVTLKLKKGLPSLRWRPLARIIWAGLHVAKDRYGVRVVEFSIQGDHIHLILEAEGARALSKAMQALCIRLAKALRKEIGGSGSVFADRYHVHVLKTPAETRAALAYVLNNKRRHGKQHGQRFGDRWVDPLSSAGNFDGWSDRDLVTELRKTGPPPDAYPVEKATKWLLKEGWRKRGLIDVCEIPGRQRSAIR